MPPKVALGSVGVTAIYSCYLSLLSRIAILVVLAIPSTIFDYSNSVLCVVCRRLTVHSAPSAGC